MVHESMIKSHVIWSSLEKDIQITICLILRDNSLKYYGVGTKMSTGNIIDECEDFVLEEVMKWAVRGGARFLIDDAHKLKKAYQTELEKLNN